MKRLAVLGALGTTLGIAAPVTSASAAGTPGPVVITTAPSSFVNANNQDSVGGNAAGVQVAGP